jgi:hypothetical protein
MTSPKASGAERRFPSKRHHWWPKALSGFWAGSDGMVSQLLHNGEETRQVPSEFGHDKHSHNLRMGGPWDSSFEHMFNRADSSMKDFISWLGSLEVARERQARPIAERLIGQRMANEQRAMMSECLASLIVRSPQLRHRMGRRLHGYDGIFPPMDETGTATAVAYNIRGLFRPFTNHMTVGGKFALLLSDDREFIFGDGFFHNIPTNGATMRNLKCIVPLTPGLAVLYTKPFQWVSRSDLVSVVLRDEEVDLLNTLVQVYSCDKVFFRNDRPWVHGSFAARRHEEIEEGSCLELEQLFEAVAMTPAPLSSPRN